MFETRLERLRRKRLQYYEQRKARALGEKITSDDLESRVNRRMAKAPEKRTSKQSIEHFDYLPDIILTTDIPEKTNDRVFIVGGGPSLVGFPFSCLHEEDVIAVNKSILNVPGCKAFITMDYTLVDPKYAKMSFDDAANLTDNYIFILNQTEPDRIEKVGNVFVDSKFNYIYRDLYRFNIVISSKQVTSEESGFGLDVESFCHGSNSGFCAVQLAILMGYKEIYLLGFDLDSSNKTTHYHDGYGRHSQQILKNADLFASNFKAALEKFKDQTDQKIYSCSPKSVLNDTIPFKDPYKLFTNMEKKTLDDLMVVGYYTKNTLYENEAKKTIASCEKWNLNYDIQAIDDLGGWQANTRYKAKFMKEMLEKHPDKRLLYVDCDAIIQKEPILFLNYEADIAVRWQDFRWRENECLSGTIYMENNERTHKLCDIWLNNNITDREAKTSMEQWNLDKAIAEMKSEGLVVKNLPPEYTFIFDHMKKIFPNVEPVIEHFQASRRARKRG